MVTGAPASVFLREVPPERFTFRKAVLDTGVQQKVGGVQVGPSGRWGVPPACRSVAAHSSASAARCTRMQRQPGAGALGLPSRMHSQWTSAPRWSNTTRRRCCSGRLCWSAVRGQAGQWVRVRVCTP